MSWGKHATRIVCGVLVMGIMATIALTFALVIMISMTAVERIGVDWYWGVIGTGFALLATYLVGYLAEMV